MSVPEDIRAVPRPTNSVVFNSGSNGPKQYYVRMHNGYKHVEGKPSQPTFGPVIGYIINHQFVQTVQPTKLEVPEIASYGSSALIHSVADDLYQDLLKVYQPNEALTLMALAGVRVVKPHISNARAAKEYRSTFLQVYYPNAALSERLSETTWLSMELSFRTTVRSMIFLRTPERAGSRTAKIFPCCMPMTSRGGNLSVPAYFPATGRIQARIRSLSGRTISAMPSLSTTRGSLLRQSEMNLQTVPTFTISLRSGGMIRGLRITACWSSTTCLRIPTKLFTLTRN